MLSGVKEIDWLVFWLFAAVFLSACFQGRVFARLLPRPRTIQKMGQRGGGRHVGWRGNECRGSQFLKDVQLGKEEDSSSKVKVQRCNSPSPGG
jgi:hypothetical protein